MSPTTEFAPWNIRNLERPPDPSNFNWNAFGTLLSSETAPLSKSLAPSKAKLAELIHKKARNNITQFTQKRYEKYIKENSHKTQIDIKIGDKIMVRDDRFKNKSKTTEAKLTAKWLGPFTVLRKNASNTSFEVSDIRPGAQRSTFWANVRRIRLHPSSRGERAGNEHYSSDSS